MRIFSLIIYFTIISNNFKYFSTQFYKKNQEEAFTIDQLNDQELFVLDLKYKYPDLTDEELAIELENAVEDEALFAKKVGKLRKDYLELEKQQAEEAE